MLWGGVLVACLASTTIAQRDLSGQWQENHNCGSDICQSIWDCPPVLELLKEAKQNRNHRSYLRSLLCGFDKDQPKVCCPVSNTEEEGGREIVSPSEPIGGVSGNIDFERINGGSPANLGRNTCKTGTCINLRICPPILKILEKAKTDKSLRPQLNSLLCGFDKDQPKVCCPVSNTEEEGGREIVSPSEPIGGVSGNIDFERINGGSPANLGRNTCKTGTCINLRICPPILKILEKAKTDKSLRPQLNSLLCGFDKDQPKVCCPVSNTEEEGGREIVSPSEPIGGVSGNIDFERINGGSPANLGRNTCKTGTCINLRICPPILKILEKAKTDKSLRPQLNSLLCGFDKDQPKVCCPVSNTEEEGGREIVSPSEPIGGVSGNIDFERINGGSPANLGRNTCKTGTCINLRICPPILKILEKAKTDKSLRPQLNSLLCGFDKDQPKVCCPVSNTEEEGGREIVSPSEPIGGVSGNIDFERINGGSPANLGRNTCKTGTCINLRICPPILKILEKAKTDKSLRPQLNSLLCGFDKDQPKVCCPVSNTEEEGGREIVSPSEPIGGVSGNIDFERINGGSPANLGRNTCKTGTCINLRICPPILKILEKAKTDKSLRPQLNSLLCGFDKDQPKVCCPVSNTEEEGGREIVSPSEPIGGVSGNIDFERINGGSPANLGRNTCKTGTCINLRICPPILKILEKAKTDKSLRPQLNSLLCGFDKDQPKVCCPLTNTEVEGEGDIVLPSEPNCGVSDNIDFKRIEGGSPATLGQWPWMAVLGYRKKHVPSSKTSWLCGGALITQRHVLTAAHCLNNPNFVLYKVKLGDLDINDNVNDGATPIERFIEKAIPHEGYMEVSNDIAILKLDKSVTLTNVIQPICLPIIAALRSQTFERMSPFTAGWGKLKYKGATATHLQFIQFPVVNNTFCDDIFKRHNIQITSSQICAGVLTGHEDACQGDSGGPLMIPNRMHFYHIGVVSFGFRCGAVGYPGVYTRTTEYIDWISAKIKL